MKNRQKDISLIGWYKGSGLVIYCCVKNTPEISGLKQDQSFH